MKISKPILIVAVAFLIVPGTSFAFSQTISNGQTATVTVPDGVTAVGFYAKGGDGGTSSGGGGGGGGAGAFSTKINGYVLIVGGGGGAGYGSTGGIGGTTSGAGVGVGGIAGGNFNFVSDNGTKNGSGGTARGFQTAVSGGSPGNGGNSFYGCSSYPYAYSTVNGGAGASGLASGAGTTCGTAVISGGTAPFGGGNAGIGIGGGGGGYGGGGGGANFAGGGGGSSYFDSNLSSPDANGYVSIPVSYIGTSIRVDSGTGGSAYQSLNAAGKGGLITITWPDPPAGGTIKVSTNNDSASWTITGKSVYITGSGKSQTSASEPVGDYTITWNAVAGYVTPASQSQSIVSNGSTITFSGTYTQNPTVNLYFSFVDTLKAAFPSLFA